MLTMAVVIPITGFLLQRFNTRPVFIAAMSLFSAGTLIAALAPGFEVLLGARVVQATGTAIMMPLLMTTLMTLVAAVRPRQDHGQRLDRHVGGTGDRPDHLGPHPRRFLSWRWMFWLVLPIALAMLIIGIRRVENVSETRVLPIDVFSVILSAFGFGGLVYGLSLVGGVVSGSSADAPAMWISLAVGAIGIALVRRAPADAAAPRQGAARPAHVPLAQLLGVDRPDGRHDGGAVRHHHPAADLPAERARARPALRSACCCCPAG